MIQWFLFSCRESHFFCWYIWSNRCVPWLDKCRAVGMCLLLLLSYELSDPLSLFCVFSFFPFSKLRQCEESQIKKFVGRVNTKVDQIHQLRPYLLWWPTYEPLLCLPSCGPSLGLAPQTSLLHQCRPGQNLPAQRGNRSLGGWRPRCCPNKWQKIIGVLIRARQMYAFNNLWNLSWYFVTILSHEQNDSHSQLNTVGKSLI